MARVRFIGPGDTCTVFGATFHLNRWTTSHGLPDADVARLAVNPTFEVEDQAQDGDPDPEEAQADFDHGA
jgi:hypothetical protein